MSIGSGISEIGQGVTDFMQAGVLSDEAHAFSQEAGIYGEAMGLAEQNKAIEQSSTNIQEFQVSRQATQAIGTENAQLGKAGVEQDSGSALYLLRSSQEQANIAKSLVQQQGQIKENAYQEQADAYHVQQLAAESSAKAAAAASSEMDVAGVFGIIGGVADIGTSAAAM